MSKSIIIALPHLNLRKRSQKVGIITDEIRAVVQAMEGATIDWDQSRSHEVGVALAAVQIDALLRIIVVRNNFDNKDDHTFTTFINPEITKFEGTTEDDFEGCLSVKDIYGKVPRYTKVRVKALNLDGREFRITAEGFLARIFQHEIDHLNGILFIDHIRDNKDAFYVLQPDGNLQQLDYEKEVRKIVFFGNERLATGVTTSAPTLRSLINAGYDITGVVLNYTDAHSRNPRVLEVSEIAKQKNIPLWLPHNVSEIASELKHLNADIGVLAAYGKIIPQSIINIFQHGIINIHPSLLPFHRGSTPIESAILEGASETGVSIMQLVKEMDAGPLYAQEKYIIPKGITKQLLADNLLLMGSRLIIKILPNILEDSLTPNPQHNDTATYDSLIKKEDGRIVWSKPATQIEREIRAYAIWPKSQAIIGGKNVVITEAETTEQYSDTPGNISNQTGRLLIQCGRDALEIKMLIPAGKKEMSAQAFLAGYGKLLQ